MFSEALYIMDRNAERLMVDELRQKVQKAEEEISAKDIVIRERDQALSEKEREIQKLKEQLSLFQASNN